MRKVPRTAKVLTAVLLVSPLLGQPGRAEDVYNLNQNQTGFTLPGVTLPQGQDEVRAADGTTCRSSVSGSGSYFDLGVIQGASRYSGDLATYGRVVIPIGRQPKRIDCRRLYDLEVERLQMELKLLKMGLGEDTTASIEKPGRGSKEAWATEGWTTRGTK